MKWNRFLAMFSLAGEFFFCFFSFVGTKEKKELTEATTAEEREKKKITQRNTTKISLGLGDG